MRLYTIAARYRRYLESALDITRTEITNDQECRAPDMNLAHIAPINDGFIEPERTGTLVVFVVDVENPQHVAKLEEIARTLTPVALRSA